MRRFCMMDKSVRIPLNLTKQCDFWIDRSKWWSTLTSKPSSHICFKRSNPPYPTRWNYFALKLAFNFKQGTYSEVWSSSRWGQTLSWGWSQMSPPPRVYGWRRRWRPWRGLTRSSAESGSWWKLCCQTCPVRTPRQPPWSCTLSVKITRPVLHVHCPFQATTLALR